MIRDTTAHRIAADWHGGQGSALYALSSSGAIIPGLIAELNLILERPTVVLEPAERKRVASLVSYAIAKGFRGPVEGWHQNVICRAYKGKGQ